MRLDDEYQSLSDEAIIAIIQEEMKVDKGRDPILDANDTVNALFETLYGRYQRSIHAYIARLIFDKDAVDDIFHDVIIKVYTNMHRFVHKTSFKSWIYKIATNVSINYIKRHRYKEKLTLNAPLSNAEGERREVIDLVKGKDEDLEMAIMMKDVMEELRRIVVALPKELREVFVLKKNEKLTYDEVAEIVGCSSRHVKTRMAKALHIITDELKKRNITKEILDF